MPLRRLDPTTTLALTGGAALLLAIACTREPVIADGTTGTSTSSGTSTVADGVDGIDDDDDGDDGDNPDFAQPTPPPTGGAPDCVTDGSCRQIDLVLVIDNSSRMGLAQLDLMRHVNDLVHELQDVKDGEGNNINPDVNVMVTTTDMGHPLCESWYEPDYTPRLGAPVYSGCNERINRFSNGFDPLNPEVIPEACTENCPVDILPGAHFVHFDPTETNAPNDDVAAALSCIAPQGVDGCFYEAPLESMLQAINPQACWNDPAQAACDDDAEWAEATEGFLRENALLAVALVTNELDCSVQPPGGYSYFTDPENSEFWNENPNFGMPMASSAICFNAGVTCTDADGDDIYDGCASSGHEALFPVERYIEYFDQLEQQGKEVVMLGLLGVPPVVSHNPERPFTPTGGGVVDLAYRGAWIDAPYPAGDIVPEDWDNDVRAENKVWSFGDLAPGCFKADGSEDIDSEALPPIRLREVCESLNGVDELGDPITRCCIESVCDNDLFPAIICLTGMISEGLDRLEVQG